MTTEQEKHEFLNTLFEHWDNIRTVRESLAHSLLSDMVDAAIKDIDDGNLSKKSHIIEYIRFINDEICGGKNND